ncbi:uncharacterized protein PRCAT00001296001 [Priceomyces carsonii]|uniref:uncharacterized protein n=1 Tax=Priceomyces carsonii TaxID=28549 RepID=UPI002EDB3263|nr:unnamed protein product [Priceomyces carsonii]
MTEKSPFMHLVRPNVAAPAASLSISACKVKIHNSALFQILEIISKQVLDSDKRIIGTLLGIRSDDGSEFEVRDAFMVPCSETGDSIAIEDHTHRTMYQLYKKAHPKEYVLGWFGSADEIDNTTGLIHDFYSKGSDRAYPFPAIYLNVEYLNKENEITMPQVSSYIGSAIGKTSSSSQRIGWKTLTTNSYLFTPIPNEIICGSVTEKLALNLLKDNSTRTGAVSLERDMSFLSEQLAALTESIDKLLGYVESSDMDTDENVNLLRLLCNNLLNRPQVLPHLEDLERHFRDHNQDIIMIEYLTKAIKDQIELSARLTASAEADRKN